MLPRLPDTRLRIVLSPSSSKDARPVRKLETSIAAPPVAGSVEMGGLRQIDGDAGAIQHLVSALAAPARSIGCLVQMSSRWHDNGVASVVDSDEASLTSPGGAVVCVGQIRVLWHGNRRTCLCSGLIATITGPSPPRGIVRQVGTLGQNNGHACLVLLPEPAFALPIVTGRPEEGIGGHR